LDLLSVRPFNAFKHIRLPYKKYITSNADSQAVYCILA
jgi:hypothetical protein